MNPPDQLATLALVVTSINPLRRLKEGDDRMAEFDDERVDRYLDAWQALAYPDCGWFGGSLCQ